MSMMLGAEAPSNRDVSHVWRMPALTSCFGVVQRCRWATTIQWRFGNVVKVAEASASLRMSGGEMLSIENRFIMITCIKAVLEAW